ncbi:MAG: hypothetical protein PSN34_08870 [Urechidicola sp.]|nr:hypothetical protein [Urechidicola sp.]
MVGIPSSLEVEISDVSNFSDGEDTLTKEAEIRSRLESIISNSHFSNGFLTSYTYDPLIGMTSSTDTKGYTTFYKYDNQNRLLRILDQDLNIIEEYDYNYRNQSEISSGGQTTECDSYTITILGRADDDEFSYSYTSCDGSNISIVGFYGEQGYQTFSVCVKQNTGGVTTSGVASGIYESSCN